MSAKQKIAVLGASGFIGNAFLIQAKKLNYETVAIARAAVDFVLPNSHKIMTKLMQDCTAVVVLAALTPKKDLTSLQYTMRFMDNLRIAENIIKAIVVTKS